MIILGLRLRNIRSYRDKTIIFPQKGVTVIYGDVGTGKSTILSSISYAIFGQTGVGKANPLERFALPKAEDLLRIGEVTGTITLLLKQGNMLILIERVIKRERSAGKDRYVDRGGSIRVYQLSKDPETGETICKLIEFRSYSAQDLRRRVLELLGLPEPQKRKKPLIFTNTVYVPQFGVHDIINLSEQERKDLINTVINLSRYSNARTNIEKIARGKYSVLGNILSELKTRKEEKERFIRDKSLEEIDKEIKDYEERLRKIEDEYSKTQSRLQEISKEINKQRSAIQKVTEEKISVEQELKRINQLEEKRRILNRQLENLLQLLEITNVEEVEKARKRLEEETAKLKEELCELKKKREEIIAKIDENDREIDNLGIRRQELLGHISRLRGEINGYRSRKQSLLKEIQRIKKLLEQGICPVCGQRVTHEHGTRLLEEKQAELNSIEENISKLEQEIKSLEEKLRLVEKNIQNKRALRKRISHELREIDKKIDNKNQLLNTRKDLLRQIDKINDIVAQIRELNEYIRKKPILSKQVEEYRNTLKILRKQLSELEDEERRLKKRIEEISREKGRLEATLDNLRSLREQYTEIMKEIEKLRKDIEFYERVYKFLYDKNNGIFLKILSVVEDRVRKTALDFFRRKFIEYFTYLMEGHEMISVDIGPDFLPIVKARSGAVIGRITQPSGGQLTSISLAYRLALNQVARAMVPQLRKSTLILDEPTYGFSPERVERLKELLRTINSEGASQIIIVTHDQNLLAVGDCKIKLSIDRDKNETTIDYEECLLDEAYKEIVEDLLLKRTFKQEESKETSLQPITSSFKTYIKPIKQSYNHETRKKQRNMDKKTLLDYFKT